MAYRRIQLGAVTIAKYKPGQNLFPKWMREVPEYHQAIKRAKPDDFVLPKGNYELVIDYPLSKPYEMLFNASEGLTRAGLVTLIVDSYRYVYDEEDRTVGKKTRCIPGMLNRATSNGRFGIWGHHIGDLILCSARVSPKGRILLGVDS